MSTESSTSLIDRFGRRATVAALGLALINIYGVLPALNTTQQIVAVPLLIAASFVHVWLLRMMWRALWRGVARVS